MHATAQQQQKAVRKHAAYGTWSTGSGTQSSASGSSGSSNIKQACALHQFHANCGDAQQLPHVHVCCTRFGSRSTQCTCTQCVSTVLNVAASPSMLCASVAAAGPLLRRIYWLQGSNSLYCCSPADHQQQQQQHSTCSYPPASHCHCCHSSLGSSSVCP